MADRRVVDIGPARLILGSSYEERPNLGFKDADVFDPPYLIKTEGAGKLRKSRTYLDDLTEAGLNEDFDHSIINPLLCGSCLVFCSDSQLPTLLPYMNGLFHRFALCFMAKRNPLPVANKSLLSDVEPAIRAWNRGWHPVGEIGDRRKAMIYDENDLAYVENIAEETTVTPSKVFGHPTVKPLNMMRRIIRTTNGEEIVDSFMGTGTTGVACILEGKRFIGIEHNEKHFETAIKRIEEAVRTYDEEEEARQASKT